MRDPLGVHQDGVAATGLRLPGLLGRDQLSADLAVREHGDVHVPVERYVLAGLRRGEQVGEVADRGVGRVARVPDPADRPGAVDVLHDGEVVVVLDTCPRHRCTGRSRHSLEGSGR